MVVQAKDGNMKLSEVCKVRLVLLHKWADAMSDQVDAATVLVRVIDEVSLPEYEAAFKKFRTLHETSCDAHVVYRAHISRHGCEAKIY